jgi:UrcA family protein
MSRLTLMAAAALALVAALPALAQIDGDAAPRKISVRYADLDLAKPRDARTLVSRIRIAANELCGPDVSGDVGRTVDRARCVHEVQDQAIRKVNRPTVTAAFRGVTDAKVFAQVSAAH